MNQKSVIIPILRDMNYSRQRESIIKCLAGRYDHPTAEMVHSSIKEDYPHVSLGTVYRNLTQLSENGDIIKISTGFGPDRFDYNVQPHSHFACRSCNKVTDLDLCPAELFDDKQLSKVPGRIERTSLIFYGTCTECLKK